MAMNAFCCNRSQFVQSVIARCLVELCTARSTFRFTIQGQDGKVYILVRRHFHPFYGLVIQSLGFFFFLFVLFPSFYFLTFQVWKLEDDLRTFSYQ